MCFRFLHPLYYCVSLFFEFLLACKVLFILATFRFDIAKYYYSLVRSSTKQMLVVVLRSRDTVLYQLTSRSRSFVWTRQPDVPQCRRYLPVSIHRHQILLCMDLNWRFLTTSKQRIPIHGYNGPIIAVLLSPLSSLIRRDPRLLNNFSELYVKFIVSPILTWVNFNF